jgi:hypothetical protein
MPHRSREVKELPNNMYSTVRRYEGVSNPEEAAKRVREGFLPLISRMPGFVAYQWVDLGNGVLLSISVFNSLAHAIESNQQAAAWVRTNLASVLSHSPRVESGKVVARIANAH